MKQHTFCSYCGAQFDQENWPKNCSNCHNTTFSNPLPVSVAIINVIDEGRLGTLIQQRNINPKKGEWALTGGYIDRGESWQEGLVREVHEELGLITNVSDYQLITVESNLDKSTMLVFGMCIRNFMLDEIQFSPNDEVSAIRIIHEPIELAFPTHTALLRKRFGQE